MAQLEDYDESFYVTKFIFGLHPTILRDVLVQRPATLLEAKRIAEELELTHLMTSEHSKHTQKKKTTKANKHSGTQERRYGRRHQSVPYRAQMKTCRVQRQRSDSHTGGCISAQRGALEVSCSERHGPAAMWRSFVKDLPPRDRAGYLRKKGSVVTVDLEALTREKERRTFVDVTVVGMSMHPPSGGLKAP